MGNIMAIRVTKRVKPTKPKRIRWAINRKIAKAKVNIKFRIANFLNNYNYCWPDLVTWALGYTEFIDISGMSMCEGEPYYYCEKCIHETPKKSLFLGRGAKYEIFPW